VKSPADLLGVAREISAILSGVGVRHHFTGGIVSTVYGEPRLTQDLDIVVAEPTSEKLDEIVRNLAGSYHVDPVAASDAVRLRRSFHVLHAREYTKVDFHVGEDIPGELDRTRILEVAPGIRLPFVSKEDAILSKLLWVKLGSSKSRRDAQMMFRRKQPLDMDYLRRTAAALGGRALLEQLLAGTLASEPE
jgi:hypothetical protein